MASHPPCSIFALHLPDSIYVKNELLAMQQSYTEQLTEHYASIVCNGTTWSLVPWS
jgi:hypothetical protein